ncbi:MAG: prevent-host-death protein [Pseudonocardiales bacterium]|nr:type II toxin-antitoxin system Phd/YefM family antitoxin [Actinomycetota bacterium]PZS12115.1 MAG: prevent-host-death protein [Pseudonocardiales bacterium]
MKWQLQEAKQRFSEVVRAAQAEGAQFVTRHGEEVAVVVDIAEYRRMTGADVAFKDYLRSAPDFDALEIVRPRQPARAVEFADER